MEKVKNSKTKNINVNNIIYDGKKIILSLKKIKLLGKRNNKLNNKINIKLKKENVFDIFINIIKIKEKICYNEFIILSENNILKYSFINFIWFKLINKFNKFIKYSITTTEEGEKKIYFEYQYNPNSLDGNLINQKCLNVINVFQLINKVI